MPVPKLLPHMLPMGEHGHKIGAVVGGGSATRG
jgi:hypothetical protein